MIFDLRTATIEGEPQEMAEFVLTLERMQTEEAMSQMRSTLDAMGEEEEEEEEDAEPVDVAKGDTIELKEGGYYFVINTRASGNIELAELGEGMEVTKTVKANDVLRILSVEETDEAYWERRRKGK